MRKMKQRWMLLFFCMTGLLFAFACGRKVPEAPESATTLTLFPTITQAPSPVPTAVEPTLSPVPSVLIPDDIVDTGKEPYTYDEMCEDLELLAYAYPDIISLSWEGKSADERRIPAVFFGNPEAEHTLFIQAAIHGREHLTTLLVMEQLETYAREYDTGSYSGRTYREIFSDVALLVVPMTNPDGVSISQLGTESIETEELRALVEGFYERDGAGMTREYFYRRYKANANGVDLNRNFAYGFEEFVGNAVPAADRYKGEAPASEPETRYLMELTESRQTAAALSYHATGSVLYWDFGQTGAFREKCLSFVNVVHELTGYRIVYAASEKQDAAGYCEWAAGIKGIPEVTIEIGTVAAPLPISQFENIWLENRDVPAAVAVQVQKLYENAE